jgi:hypothetical protein
MDIMKLLRQLCRRFLQHVQALAQAVAIAVRQWRLQPGLDALEAERLDRIRNPSKYLGKP